MKSLSFYILAIIILFSNVANAQKIYFTDMSNKWIVKVSQYFAGTHRWEDRIEKMQFDNQKDTFLSGKTYKLLRGIGYSDVLVREDIDSGKVYFRYIGDTFEQAFFNYNIQLNDTLRFNVKLEHSKTYLPHQYIITQIDSVQINGTQHKQFYIDGKDTNQNVVKKLLYGEGLGNPSVLFYSPDYFYAFTSVPAYQLICFKNNDTDAVFSNNVYKLDCNDSLYQVNVYNLEKQSGVLTIYPQPTSSVATIILPQETNGIVSITNSMAQIVHKENFKLQSKLNINRNEQMSAGIYFYHILDNKTGISYTGKLLFE